MIPMCLNSLGKQYVKKYAGGGGGWGARVRGILLVSCFFSHNALLVAVAILYRI